MGLRAALSVIKDVKSELEKKHCSACTGRECAKCGIKFVLELLKHAMEDAREASRYIEEWKLLRERASGVEGEGFRWTLEVDDGDKVEEQRFSDFDELVSAVLKALKLGFLEIRILDWDEIEEKGSYEEEKECYKEPEEPWEPEDPECEW